MKAVLISIKPKWCDLIRRGRKTVEIRKTCPKLEVPFKVYIYETMDGGRGSGLVFGEFVCTGFDVFRPIGKGISIKFKRPLSQYENADSAAFSFACLPRVESVVCQMTSNGF